jgi:hypothetical protein
MVTVMQYMEGLTDRQAAEAVRGRIDWKYTQQGHKFNFFPVSQLAKQEIL